MPTKPKGIRQRNLRLPLQGASGPDDDAHVDAGVGVLDVERRVHLARHDRLDRRHGLDGARGTKQVADHRLGAVDPHVVPRDRPSDGLELRDVAGGRRGRVGVDVVDLLRGEARCGLLGVVEAVVEEEE